MAEERTLGLARAQEWSAEEPSKEELQRRLDHTRDSISQTVTEIKETVANQVQAVKNTLDWREQFKKRPVAWSAGALGVGFLTGYCIANTFKGDDDYRQYSSAIDRYAEESKTYAAQPVLGAASMSTAGTSPRMGNGSKDHGPGILEKITNTHAYEKVRDEAGNLGNAFVQELANTAKTVVLPALITSLKNFIGGHLPNAPKSQHEPQYEPAREH
jgi:hypothetical protein